MNIMYAKTVLNVYPKLKKEIHYLNKTIDRKSIGSRLDYRPAGEIYDKIIQLVFRRNILIAIKELVDVALENFNEHEKRYFRGRYFKEKNNPLSISHKFKPNPKLDEEFAKFLEKTGINDSWFESEALDVHLVKHYLKRTIKEESTISQGE